MSSNFSALLRKGAEILVLVIQLLLATPALDPWPSSQGERFTTKLWSPGLTEKAIRKIMDS